MFSFDVVNIIWMINRLSKRMFFTLIKKNRKKKRINQITVSLCMNSTEPPGSADKSANPIIRQRRAFTSDSALKNAIEIFERKTFLNKQQQQQRNNNYLLRCQKTRIALIPVETIDENRSVRCDCFRKRRFVSRWIGVIVCFVNFAAVFAVFATNNIFAIVF